jgi:rhodanese-related sulfurtransferase
MAASLPIPEPAAAGTTASEPVIAEGRGFLRLQPREADAAQHRGALIVDIRPASVRRQEGEIPGALVVAGPLREWRLGPQSPERVCELGDRCAVIVVCAHGASSLLAASALYGMGVAGATDIVGGFHAWVEAGLPTAAGGTLAGRFVPARAGADAPAGALV